MRSYWDPHLTERALLRILVGLGLGSKAKGGNTLGSPRDVYTSSGPGISDTAVNQRCVPSADVRDSTLHSAPRRLVIGGGVKNYYFHKYKGQLYILYINTYIVYSLWGE